MLKETKLTAYCGFYCSDCIRYRSRASDLARNLLIELKSKGFDEYAKLKGSTKKQFDSIKQFENYKEGLSINTLAVMNRTFQ